MDEHSLRARLPVSGLGAPLHYYASIGSTNDRCVELGRAGAPHGTLVVADEQRAGRGRGERRWFTLPGTALAMSLLVRPPGSGGGGPSGVYAMLGALAVVQALDEIGLNARIKWPNDVVVEQGKVAGVLAEASWTGGALNFVVIGIGVNIAAGSIPPEDALEFPAACVETACGGKVEREVVLASILGHLSDALVRVGDRSLLVDIDDRLAYRKVEVEIMSGGRRYAARIDGLEEDGSLRVVRPEGTVERVDPNATLRPVDLRPV